MSVDSIAASAAVDVSSDFASSWTFERGVPSTATSNTRVRLAGGDNHITAFDTVGAFCNVVVHVNITTPNGCIVDPVKLTCLTPNGVPALGAGGIATMAILLLTLGALAIGARRTLRQR
jgi:hypothetical protein